MFGNTLCNDEWGRRQSNKEKLGVLTSFCEKKVISSEGQGQFVEVLFYSFFNISIIVK